MDDREFNLKNGIRQLIENELFAEAVAQVKQEIALEMANEADADKRNQLFATYHAVDRVVGKFNSYANDVRMITGTKDTQNADRIN